MSFQCGWSLCFQSLRSSEGTALGECLPSRKRSSCKDAERETLLLSIDDVKVWGSFSVGLTNAAVARPGQSS